jgi:Na+/phosphate symporter
MPNEKKFTRKQVITALKKTGGFITHAANMLGCRYETIERYIRDDPSIGVEMQHIKENRLDLAETVVMKHLKAENLEAAKYYLKYMGRTRGYIKAQKIEISDNLSELMEAADKRMP